MALEIKMGGAILNLKLHPRDLHSPLFPLLQSIDKF